MIESTSVDIDRSISVDIDTSVHVHAGAKQPFLKCGGCGPEVTLLLMSFPSSSLTYSVLAKSSQRH